MALKSKACKHGMFTFFDNDKYIGGALDQTGEYSEQEVQKLLSVLNHDSIMIEVGANIGAITVPLAKHVAKLIAFEPQPAICELLRRNIRQNALDPKVAVVQCAVGAVVGNTALASIDYDAPGINTGGVAIGGKGEIPLITLDDYCGRLSRLDLIKIDVEGMEREVLVGAQQTIARLRPLLYVENDRADNSVALIKHIMCLGYCLYWHLPALFNPDPTNNMSLISMNMLCVPAQRQIIDTDVTPVLGVHDDWERASQRLSDRASFSSRA
jgi:FkbM family methyltransferase